MIIAIGSRDAGLLTGTAALIACLRAGGERRQQVVLCATQHGIGLLIIGQCQLHIVVMTQGKLNQFGELRVVKSAPERRPRIRSRLLTHCGIHTGIAAHGRQGRTFKVRSDAAR
ncbi:hypothetical protein D3C71_1732110 [compost metagenome]